MSGYRIAKVSRAALAALGAPNYARGSIVEFVVAPHQTRNGALIALLNPYRPDLTAAEVETALKAHPVTTAKG